MTRFRSIGRRKWRVIFQRRFVGRGRAMRRLNEGDMRIDWLNNSGYGVDWTGENRLLDNKRFGGD